MNRAAIASESFARERREQKLEKTREKAAEEASNIILSAQWQDPMAAGDQRVFASEIRSNARNAANDQMPEWKRISQNRERNLGKRTSLSIKEQRESLPVF